MIETIISFCKNYKYNHKPLVVGNEISWINTPKTIVFSVGEDTIDYTQNTGKETIVGTIKKERLELDLRVILDWLYDSSC